MNNSFNVKRYEYLDLCYIVIINVIISTVKAETFTLTSGTCLGLSALWFLVGSLVSLWRQSQAQVIRV